MSEARYCVQAEQTLTVTLSPSALRQALFQEIFSRTAVADDGGADWYTDEAGNTYIAERAWRVSSDPLVATLVDAAAIIVYGRPSKLEG